MAPSEKNPDEALTTSRAWLTTTRRMARQTKILESLGGRLTSFPIDSDPGYEGVPTNAVRYSILAPPGLRPEDVLIQVTVAESGYTVCARPGWALLTQMANLKRAGWNERQIVDALNAQLNGMDTQTSGDAQDEQEEEWLQELASSPEFGEIIERIHASRDPDDVPTDAQDAIGDFIQLLSKCLLGQPFSPMTYVCLDAVKHALAVEGMTADALSRLSAVVDGCHAELMAKVTRIERNRTKRRRRTRRH